MGVRKLIGVMLCQIGVHVWEFTSRVGKHDDGRRALVTWVRCRRDPCTHHGEWSIVSMTPMPPAQDSRPNLRIVR